MRNREVGERWPTWPCHDHCHYLLQWCILSLCEPAQCLALAHTGSTRWFLAAKSLLIICLKSFTGLCVVRPETVQLKVLCNLGIGKTNMLYLSHHCTWAKDLRGICLCGVAHTVEGVIKKKQSWGKMRSYSQKSWENTLMGGQRKTSTGLWAVHTLPYYYDALLLLLLLLICIQISQRNPNHDVSSIVLGDIQT